MLQQPDSDESFARAPAKRPARSARGGVRWRRGLRVESLEDRQLLTSVPWGAEAQDTAEFMLGDVLVSLVLFESDGRRDANQETWTPTAVERVKANVQQGLKWWEDLLARQDTVHELHFQIDTTFADRPVRTGYEPIARQSDDFVLWIEDFFAEAGVAPGSSYSERIRQFNHAQRVKHETNWAFTIMVVNAGNDDDGRFEASGSFAQSFAFAGGRFFVMTSQRPASTVAHETGHMFWALDEYAGGRPYTDERGYYDVQNRNAADGHPDPDARVPSIMDSHVIAYPLHAASPSALEMIGWRDADHDRIFDVLDVPLTLHGDGEFLADESLYHFRGQSQVGTLPNRNPSGSGHAMTLNRVSHVEVRFAPSDWQIVEVYGQYTVDLDLTVPVPAGATGIEIRTVDAPTGVTSPIFEDVLPEPELSWQNPDLALDINGDQLVTPLDALLVINELNSTGPGPLHSRTALGGVPVFLDSNGDGYLSALDALLVINELNAAEWRSSGPGGGRLVVAVAADGRGRRGRPCAALTASAVDASLQELVSGRAWRRRGELATGAR